MRGFKSPRCATCCLPVPACVCPWTPSIVTQAHFWIVLHPQEYTKPSNTARLLSTTIPQTRRFLWQGPTAPPTWQQLIRDPRCTPYLVFPHGHQETLARLPKAGQSADTIPAFVFLDGTWEQVRRMLRRSPYLWSLPRLSLTPVTPSEYTLRQQHHTAHLATVEVAIALLEHMADLEASRLLAAYFRLFVAHAVAARGGYPIPASLPERQILEAHRQRQGTREIPSHM